ncbi:hypothetical protein KAR91_58845, partial [Candidatus Pacearchaeota archaeon]|nr:hypothetical protein [Candidatus Pacearchaeota archaeon]
MKILRATSNLFTILTFILLTACGGGGSDTTQDTPTATLASLMSTLESTLLTMDTSYTVDPLNPQIAADISGNLLEADLIGFAFCTPNDLYVAPDAGLRSGITSIYDCDNSLTLAYSNPASSSLTVTLT